MSKKLRRLWSTTKQVGKFVKEVVKKARRFYRTIRSIAHTNDRFIGLAIGAVVWIVSIGASVVMHNASGLEVILARIAVVGETIALVRSINKL